MIFHVPTYKVFNAGDTEEIDSFINWLKSQNIIHFIHPFTFLAFDSFRKVQYPLDRVKIVFSKRFKETKEESNDNVEKD